MTKLLISVKDLQEARIISSYTNVIDFKNPFIGPLGSWKKKEILSAVNSLGDRYKLSATIGNIDKNSEILQKITSYDNLRLDYIKIGIFRDSISNLKSIISIVNSQKLKTNIVFVFFVENKNLINFLRNNLNFLHKNNVKFFLLDTMNKSSGNLLTHTSINFLRKLIELSNHFNIKIGLAGKIKTENIKELIKIKPFIIGIRTAVCKNTNRKLSLSTELAEKLYHKFNSEIKYAQAVAGT